MATAAADQDSKNLHQREDSVSPSVIAHIRRQYRILKRADLIYNPIRLWWSRAVQRWTESNRECVTDIHSYQNLLNKCAMYYYTTHVQLSPTDMPEHPGAAVCKRWYRAHDDQPNIDWNRYFAYPFLIDTPKPMQPSDIIQMHQGICRQAVRYHQNAFVSPPGPPPPPFRGIYPQNYKMYPLCLALLVIQDSFINIFEWHEGKRYNGGHPRDDKTFIDMYGQTQTVVIVRTGNEKDLKIPISFLSLADKALPLNRAGVPSYDGIDAIRVSLYDAVDFIASLQKKEEEANFDFYYNPRVDDSNSQPLKLLNPPGGVEDSSWWTPPSEDEFITELLIKGKYSQSEIYIGDAKRPSRSWKLANQTGTGTCLNRNGDI
ncbi:hypothetical protein DM02DRAFT_710448 [Periconia macrospinosa]|uniref:Uncharacterized protein n=1 Tax=Periconia macrospinosa TaxID=97972 RepID=A0A2V1DR18_9PLEO|nr:hypothetical protein DM02DRAFT_710448 [Periconia macrospinosa]